MEKNIGHVIIIERNIITVVEEAPHRRMARGSIENVGTFCSISKNGSATLARFPRKNRAASRSEVKDAMINAINKRINEYPISFRSEEILASTKDDASTRNKKGTPITAKVMSTCDLDV